MPFRPRKKQPQFADLKGILAQIRTHADTALYQTIQQIIERLTQFQIVLNEELADKLDDEDAAGFAPSTATFLTESDETAILPNSYQLIEGTNITFDTSVPNQLEISSSGGSGVDHVAMSTGAEPVELMSNGAGQILYVGFTPP